MNLIKIKSLTINLDRVIYWTAIPASIYRSTAAPGPAPGSRYAKPLISLYDDAAEQIVVIHFSEPGDTLRLNPIASKAFLAYAEANLGIQSIQVDGPAAASDD
jgi:hypothetical protein